MTPPPLDPARAAVSPQLRIFSEVRLHRGPGGTLLLRDLADASVWEPYRRGGLDLDVAARVGPPATSATLEVGDVPVHPLPYYEGPLGLLRQLPRVLVAVTRATRGPALSMFRLPGTQSLLGAVVARVTRRPYVAEVVGDPEAVLRSGVAGAPGRLLAPVGAAAMRWAVRGALAVRYVTRHTMQDLYPAGPGARQFSYSTVVLGPDDVAARPQPQPAVVQQLLAIGTQDQWYKGHDVLLEAVGLLRQRGCVLRLTLVGGGRHHDELRALAGRLGVASQVTFAGRVNDRSEVRRLFAEADLFCMPSRTEGLPRALLEAMAAGLPAVGTTVGGIPELLPADLLVPADDPRRLADLLLELAGDQDRRRRAAAANWRLASGYGPAQQAGRQAWYDCVTSLATGSDAAGRRRSGARRTAPSATRLEKE